MSGPATFLVALLLAPPVPRLLVPTEPVEMVEAGQVRNAIRLAPQGMLVLEIDGPVELGLRLRGLSQKGAHPVPLDLTVVRDDQEQATVRIPLPAPDGVALRGDDTIEPSGEALAKVAVPPGKHTYRIVIGGPPRGALVVLFAAERLAAGAVVATPGAPAATSVPAVRRPARPPSVPPPRVLAAEIETLPAPGSSRIHRSEAIMPRVIRRESGLGPWTMTGLSLAGSLAFAGASVMISGRVQAERAVNEPVQIRAGEWHESSERSYRAGAALLGTAAAMGLLTLVAVWLESPDSPAEPRLLFRF